MKKILFGLFLSLALVPPAFAASHDFSTMSPTVKVTSYQKLFTDQVTAYGSGSGTVVSPDGIVITNHHVIFDEDQFKPLDAFEICITFDAKEEPVCEYTAHLIADDKDLDIALLKLDPKDVFGNPVPFLKTLDWHVSSAPKDQDPVMVVGYPASGGDTITTSKGQISGSETYNSYHYFKTDTDFDHGSSGGTVYDSSGHYIGIPTYIRSYAENVGYFLDLREAQQWIQANIGKNPIDNSKANGFLIRELARLSKANSSLQYTQDGYPHLSITLPKGWEFGEINDESLYATQKNLSTPLEFIVQTNPYQFVVDKQYMSRLGKEIEKIRKNSPDLAREDVLVDGKSGWKVSYTSAGTRNISYYIPYGYCLVTLSYSLSLDEASAQEKPIQQVLDQIHFTKAPETSPHLASTVSFDDPPFSITAAKGWRIQKNPGKDPEDLLAEAVQQHNFDGSLSLYYSPVAKEERDLSDAERLKAKTQSLGSNKLLTKSDHVVLGGLKGFLYTYEYEGDQYQEMKKHMHISLRNGDYEFVFEANDLSDSFDRNLPAVERMLNSFTFQGKTTEAQSVNSLGNLGFTFTDIQYHPYALEISDLADKGLATGDSEGRFNPEGWMNRGEALKIILESKNKLEIDQKSGKAVDFSQSPSKRSAFADLKATSALYPYAVYALDQKIIANGKTFRPDRPITLAECLEMVLKTYEIPLWKGTTAPVSKKFLDKGFELGLVPYGMVDPNQKLTRGEFAFMVSRITKDADNQLQFNF